MAFGVLNALLTRAYFNPPLAEGCGVLRCSLMVLIGAAACGLAGCGTETIDMATTASLGDRWKIEKATENCNAEIEKKRWGSLAAMLTYRQIEADHGFAKCMAPKLN